MEMSFSCRKCGHKFNDNQNVGVCPRCGGFGLKDPSCLCPHLSLGLSGEAQRRTGTNPACPLHGQVARTI